MVESDPPTVTTARISSDVPLSVPDSYPEDSRTGRFYAGLLSTSIFAPAFATASTIFVYVLVRQDGGALLFGTLMGLVAWIGIGLVAARFATPERASPGVYQELCIRFDALQTQLQFLENPVGADPAGPLSSSGGDFISQARREATSEARAHIDRANRDLPSPPPSAPSRPQNLP